MRILKDANKKYCFIMDMEVRDYELDCEQIVNNANYLHYMEHTRHRFCTDAGLSFIQMHNQGIDAVVRKIETPSSAVCGLSARDPGSYSIRI